MEVRFNTINKDVEKVLEQIDKHNRKFFVETAILHYIKYLEGTDDAIDLFYASREVKESKPKPKAKSKKDVKPKEPKVEDVKIKNNSEPTDNNSLGTFGW